MLEVAFRVALRRCLDAALTSDRHLLARWMRTLWCLPVAAAKVPLPQLAEPCLPARADRDMVRLQPAPGVPEHPHGTRTAPCLTRRVRLRSEALACAPPLVDVVEIVPELPVVKVSSAPV